MGVRLFGNRALVWCLVVIDYKMPKLDYDDLISGSRPCPWSPTMALHVSLNSGVEAALILTQDRQRYVLPGVGSRFGTYSLVPRDMQIPYSGAVTRYYMAHHSRRWIYQEGTLVSGSSGTTPSSSYSLRKIVPVRDPIPMIDLSDSETVEGPGWYSSQKKWHRWTLRARAPSQLMDPHYHEQQVKAASQQIAGLREQISQMDALCHMARQAHRQETASATILEIELV
ncbi:hypothetical protein M9H77_07011 [Catharanthus roseus]|uniref:Uncharacterized protein n=1 Tax=Catharanthus roseus TaxID=4058 RepID=A0ACC0BTZ3_CATRO|nr:hypothetical protein M9H77_07011 [Catharanthus roseus]